MASKWKQRQVYILLNLIGSKCDPALGHGHHTTGMTSPAYGKGTFHLYLVNQRKLTEFIICGPSFHLSVRLFPGFFYVCACIAQRVISGHFLGDIYLVFWDRPTHWDLRSLVTRWPGRSRHPLFLLLQCWEHKYVAPCPAFGVGSRDWTHILTELSSWPVPPFPGLSSANL